MFLYFFLDFDLLIGGVKNFIIVFFDKDVIIGICEFIIFFFLMLLSIGC